MDYKSCNFDDIAKWCSENGELEWLEAKVSEKVVKYIYPKVMGKKGRMVFDKKQKPIGTEESDISFVQVKRAFFEKFMPEKLPEKKATPISMVDKLKKYKKGV